MGPQFEPIVGVSPETPHDVLHLGTTVFRQEPMTRVDVIHLKGELIITRPLGPKKSQGGFSDLSHTWGQGLTWGTSLSGVCGQLARTRSAKLIDGYQPEFVGC